MVVGSEVKEEGNGCETAEGSRLYGGTTFRLQVYGCSCDCVTHGLCVGVITDTLVITELRGVRVVQIP